MKNHEWVKKKKILLVGDKGAGGYGATKKIVEFYECKSCGIQVLIKEATPHKDCDERLIESVINEPTQF